MNSKSSLASGHGRRNRLRRGGGTTAVLVCLAVSAAACGGPGGSADPGSGGQSSGVRFAECMRSHGVPNFPDPSGGEVNLSGINQNSPQYKHAAGICGRPAGAGPSQQAQDMAKGLAFARCMRAHGMTDYADPVANGQGGFTSHGSSGNGGLSPKSPAFQRAARACRSVLSGDGNPGSGSAG